MYLKRFLSIILYVALVLPLTFSSCSDSNKEDLVEPDTKAVRVTLIYAVNNSSLASYFASDRNEIVQGVLSAPGNCRLLLYCTDNDREASTYDTPVLFEAQVKDGAVSWKHVKRYDKGVLSTDPQRMEAVISDALSRYPDARFDLFFWGHGSGWVPGSALRLRPATESVDRPESYGYGGEYDAAYKAAWTDIDELAAAIPDGRFDTIWFDCCYMANIETIYELSGKCDTFVGYPTEVWGDGLDYASALSHMMRENPDIIGGVKEFFNGYNSNHEPVTATVVDMNALEPLADAVKAILASGDARPATTELINYSRHRKYYDFYDFGTFMRLTATRNAEDAKRYELISNFDKALKAALLYQAASSIDFNNILWDTEAVSGLSTHYFTESDSESDRYYHKLKWYKRVY